MVRWVDEIYDEWMSLAWDKGSFDGGLFRSEEDTWGFNDPPEGKTKDEIRFNEAPIKGPRFMMSEIFEVLENPNPTATAKNERYEIYKPYFPEEIYPKVIFDQDQTKQLDILKTDINTYVTKMTAKFILEGNVDAGWDDYIKTLNNMGVEDLVQIYQDALDVYNG